VSRQIDYALLTVGIVSANRADRGRLPMWGGNLRSSSPLDPTAPRLTNICSRLVEHHLLMGKDGAPALMHPKQGSADGEPWELRHWRPGSLWIGEALL
jgi:hypothetical protein